MVEIGLGIDWLHRGGPEIGTPSLRMVFATAVRKATGLYETPFGVIERKLNQGQEVPTLRFADVQGTSDADVSLGCCVLNDSKYGCSLDGSTLRVSLIRSSYNPDTLPEIGHHAIRLAVMPHGDIAPATLIAAAVAFNEPLVAVNTDVHTGPLAASASGVISVTPSGAVLSGLKKAEDDDGVVVRLYDTSGKDSTAKVVLDSALIGTPTSATEVDLLERPVDTPTAKATAGGFTVKLPAYGIASVKLVLGMKTK
jgi:alpha-mannosidase